MKFIFSIAGFLLFGWVILFLSSCNKEEAFITDSSARLSFSNDSVLFDTVFTTIGSATQYIMVYNREKKPIKISSITLAGGKNSHFRVNVDGMSGTQFKDVEIQAKDSMYVFVEVTVDPQNSNTPLIVTDSLIFITNGNVQKVQLVAWGQDAHFIVPNQYIKGLPPFRIVAKEGEQVTWYADKPYVIYGYAVIDSFGMLKIEAGAKIYMHTGAGIWVYKGGSIRVNGTLHQPVTFQGDRLEPWYADKPNQWDRIWINEGYFNNEFNYAIIKNGYIGIQAEILEAPIGNRLILNNTIIKNMALRNLFTKAYTVEAVNSVFGSCAEIGAYLSCGGSYDFKHCTFANYWSMSARQVPQLVISNYYKDNYNNIIYTGDLLKADFYNCIVTGSQENEVFFDKHSNTSLQFNYFFDHCLLKTTGTVVNPSHYSEILKNADPKFKDKSKDDFRILSGSAAIDKGNPNISVSFDILGVIRDVFPDIGAYEYNPTR